MGIDASYHLTLLILVALMSLTPKTMEIQEIHAALTPIVLDFIIVKMEFVKV